MGTFMRKIGEIESKMGINYEHKRKEKKAKLKAKFIQAKLLYRLRMRILHTQILCRRRLSAGECLRVGGMERVYIGTRSVKG